MLKASVIRLAAVVATAFSLSIPAQGQNIELEPGTIVGTIKDTNGSPVPNSTVVLKSVDGVDRRTVVTPANGFFQFREAKAEVPYRISVSAKDFADWTSSTVTLAPGQFKIVPAIALPIATKLTKVQVTYNPVEVATEQLKAEEKQRIFGIIPNFYVSYEPNAAPLTSKMKFKLALKVSTDPVTVAGIVVVSAAKQAGNTPDYGQGWDAYGKRVGVSAVDAVADIMIGGAILPSLLHQDPRYFYQGRGTTLSRVRHAISNPFITRGDNGKSQPNYSSLGGDLAVSAISNLYYPRSDRGVGLVFRNFAIDTVERMGATLAQEFIFARFTKRHGHVK